MAEQNKLLHKLRRLHARKSRDALLLQLHDLEDQLKTCGVTDIQARQQVITNYQEVINSLTRENTNLQEDIRRLRVQLERERAAHNVTKSETEGYKNETALIKLDIERLTEQNDILIAAMGKLL